MQWEPHRCRARSWMQRAPMNGRERLLHKLVKSRSTSMGILKGLPASASLPCIGRSEIGRSMGELWEPPHDSHGSLLPCICDRGYAGTRFHSSVRLCHLAADRRRRAEAHPRARSRRQRSHGDSGQMDGSDSFHLPRLRGSARPL
jgi:hypothetical protein